MIIVDTNVLVYLLIAGDRTPQAQALYASDPDWRSEAFVLIELSNVLATYRRRGGLSGKQSESLLAQAAAHLRG
ncbi:MAG: PIN domain-containing protein, partial [Pseudomonadota bacterium]